VPARPTRRGPGMTLPAAAPWQHQEHPIGDASTGAARPPQHLSSAPAHEATVGGELGGDWGGGTLINRRRGSPRTGEGFQIHSVERQASWRRSFTSKDGGGNHRRWPESSGGGGDRGHRRGSGWREERARALTGSV
jgi:hypothetical protein